MALCVVSSKEYKCFQKILGLQTSIENMKGREGLTFYKQGPCVVLYHKLGVTNRILKLLVLVLWKLLESSPVPSSLTFLDKPLDFILYLTDLFFALLLQAVASQIQNGSPWDR